MDQLANFVEHSPQAQAIADGQESLSNGPTLRRRLSPVFGCWLMGLPSLWTNPELTSCAQLEMDAYRLRLQSDLSRLLEGRG